MGLIDCTGLMRVKPSHPRIAVSGVMLGVVLAAAGLFAMSPVSRALIATTACPPATPGSSPCPASAYLTIDPTAGGPPTTVNVHGRQFLAGEAINLFWDNVSHVAGSARADGSGSFDQTVKPFPGDQPGKHQICVTEPPSPCATFTLEGPPTPTPPASPSPSDSPSASASPTASPTDTPSPSSLPAAAPINGIDIITRPPFVFLPIIALLALIGLVAYWALGGNQRSKPPGLPSASVVHRTARPDYLKTLERPAPPFVEPPVVEPPGVEPPYPGARPYAEQWPPAAPPPEPPVSYPEPPPPAAPPVWPSEYTPPPAGETPQPDLPAAQDNPPDLPEPGD